MRRRTFVGGLGAVTAGLAGCVQSEPAGQPTETPTSTVEPRRFDEWQDWTTMGGTAVVDPTVNTDRATAVRVVARPEDRRGGVSFRFTEPQDLSDAFVTTAVRWERPRKESDISLNVQLTDGAGNREIHAAPVDEGMHGDNAFVRLAFGYKSTPTEQPPDLTDVRQVDIYHFTGGDESMTFWLADPQIIHSDRERGAVLIHFDDEAASIYAEGYQYMRQYGMPGTFNLISRSVGDTGAVTQAQVDEMADAGWDITAHPQNGSVLGDLSADELATTFLNEQSYLENHGFESRILAWPHNSYDGEAIEIASDHFDLAFAGGFGLSAPGRVAPFTMPRASGDDPAVTKRVVDRAVRRRGLGMLTWHSIGDEPEATSVEAFRASIDYVAAADVDVLPSSALLDGTL